MDLMPVTGISLYAHLIAALGQQVGHVIQAFTVISAGILIPGDQIERDPGRNFFRPFLILYERIQRYQVVQQLQRRIKTVEGIRWGSLRWTGGLGCVVLSNRDQPILMRLMRR